MLLPPEIIEKIKRRKEDEDYQEVRLPLDVPEMIVPHHDETDDTEEITSRIIVIDL